MFYVCFIMKGNACSCVKNRKGQRRKDFTRDSDLKGGDKKVNISGESKLFQNCCLFKMAQNLLRNT